MSSVFQVIKRVRVTLIHSSLGSVCSSSDPCCFLCCGLFYKEKKTHDDFCYLISALNLEIIIISQSLHKTNPAASTQPAYMCQC